MRKHGRKRINRGDIWEKIRVHYGIEKSREMFSKICKKNKRKAVRILNDPHTPFSVLYVMMPQIESYDLYPFLTMRNKIALDEVYEVMKRGKRYEPEERYITFYDRARQAVLKWMLQTGSAADEISEDYRKTMDITASVIIDTYRDKSIFPVIDSLIFERRKRGHNIHYISWVGEKREILNFTGKSFQSSGDSVTHKAVPIEFSKREDSDASKTEIIIGDSAFDISSIISEYPEDGIERKLLNLMSEGGTQYRYDSLNALKFEVLLRKEIANAAVKLNGSGLAYSDFYGSKCNLKYWDRTENGGFALKDGAKSSEAIKDIFVNGGEYATECATAMMIIYNKAILSIFKEDIFDDLFPNTYLMNWDIREPLLEEAGILNPAGQLLPGDRGYFLNPDVDPRAPEWQGENVIALPGSMYYGHGIGIATADQIIEELNLHRKKGSERSAYFEDMAGRPDFKKLSDIYFDIINGKSNVKEELAQEDEEPSSGMMFP